MLRSFSSLALCSLSSSSVIREGGGHGDGAGGGGGEGERGVSVRQPGGGVTRPAEGYCVGAGRRILEEGPVPEREAGGWAQEIEARVPESRCVAGAAVQKSLSIGKAMKWWEKGLQPNMREIESAQDLVGSLTNAGDRLVVVDFFSPGCAGCHARHPKLAERNPDVQFFQVNYEEHKSMCYSLHVHVFPFFRFYRGAQGRLCGFSCTNATIKKFKDALVKHKPDRCSFGPARGLEESERLALAANKDLQFNYTKEPELGLSTDAAATEVIAPEQPRLPTPTKPLIRQGSEDRALVSSGR